mmetsp:Transcript_1499/g.2937  ORF Transcript_1499/g.2937 Transcript_1499/m.2937 type:complete len:341 (+) Transcript_1499:2059-3081(+)
MDVLSSQRRRRRSGMFQVLWQAQRARRGTGGELLGLVGGGEPGPHGLRGAAHLEVDAHSVRDKVVLRRLIKMIPLRGETHIRHADAARQSLVCRVRRHRARVARRVARHVGSPRGPVHHVARAEAAAQGDAAAIERLMAVLREARRRRGLDPWRPVQAHLAGSRGTGAMHHVLVHLGRPRVRRHVLVHPGHLFLAATRSIDGAHLRHAGSCLLTRVAATEHGGGLRVLLAFALGLQLAVLHQQELVLQDELVHPLPERRLFELGGRRVCVDEHRPAVHVLVSLCFDRGAALEVVVSASFRLLGFHVLGGAAPVLPSAAHRHLVVAELRLAAPDPISLAEG